MLNEMNEILDMTHNPQTRYEARYLLVDSVETPKDLLDFMQAYWAKDRTLPVPRQIMKAIRYLMNYMPVSLILATPDRDNVGFKDLIRISHSKPKDDERELLFRHLIAR